MTRTLPFLAVVGILAFAFPTHAGDKVDFARDIQPILADRCFRCHGPKKAEGGLRLDVRRRAKLGGDTGPALVERGELLARITSTDLAKRMPPGGKPLTETQVASIKSWIAAGAPWPDELAGKETFDTHWSFVPIKRPEVPPVKDKARVRNPVDAFLLARLEKHGSTFSRQADRHTLIRRLYLDLVGLPPTPVEVNVFVRDERPDWYERTVDRLLASPHFGERWGRHWLDLARFAESDGYENDRLRPDAWRFRDWVIDAFNRDLPFDQFTIQQLAGDLLPKATNAEFTAAVVSARSLIARQRNSSLSADAALFQSVWR